MKLQKKLLIILMTLSGIYAYAAGAEGGGSNRGTYLSRSGYIIHPDDIIIENYLSQYDYEYPVPDKGEVSVITESGIKDETGYILIGLKGVKTSFSELPPLNITFCIDRSGSMSDMMPWVRNSFYIFIDKVRNGDIISLVDMNSEAQTLLPPIKIESEDDRTRFKRLVDQIVAIGGTDVYAGLQQSYLEVSKNYSNEYVNRVVILTDGMHNFGEKINSDILTMAEQYKEEGIGVSSILLGLNASTGLMVNVAYTGGGSSRFISDYDEMVKIFETELDRLLVPAATSIDLSFEFNKEFKLLETWGYDYVIDDTSIKYSIPTLHNGDYETILIEFEAAEIQEENYGKLVINYLDVYRQLVPSQEYNIRNTGETVMNENWTVNSRLLRTEGLIYYCRGLIEIAKTAEKIGSLLIELNDDRTQLPQRENVVQQIKLEISENQNTISELEEYLKRINMATGIVFYEKELEILDTYRNIFNNIIEE